jgi:hypothetical protein
VSITWPYFVLFRDGTSPPRGPIGAHGSRGGTQCTRQGALKCSGLLTCRVGDPGGSGGGRGTARGARAGAVPQSRGEKGAGCISTKARPLGRQGVGRSSWGRCNIRGTAALTSECIGAVSTARNFSLGPPGRRGWLLGYNNVPDGFEGSWSVRSRGKKNYVPNKRRKVPTASTALDLLGLQVFHSLHGPAVGAVGMFAT